MQNEMKRILYLVIIFSIIDLGCLQYAIYKGEDVSFAGAYVMLLLSVVVYTYFSTSRVEKAGLLEKNAFLSITLLAVPYIFIFINSLMYALGLLGILKSLTE